MVQKRKWKYDCKGCRRSKKRIWLLHFLMGVALCLTGIWGSGVYSHAAGTAADVLAIASSQVGYHEKASEEYLDDPVANSGTANYTKYARDLGVANGQSWCGYFVWWCMKSAAVEDVRYPNVGSVAGIKTWFVNHGSWHDRGTYTPNPGDYIVFGNPLRHCGIVESVAAGRVYTIEGNSSDVVKRRDYALTDTDIVGYGAIAYTGTVPTVTPPAATQPPAATKAPVIPSTDHSNPGSPYPIPSGILATGSTGDSVKWIQSCLNELMKAGITVDGIYGSQTAAAVKAFQKANGLTADGVVGSNTTTKMLALWRKKAIGSGSHVGKGNAQVKVPVVAKVSKFRAAAKKKGLKLTWKKSSSVSGYQIQLSTKKNFKSAKTYSCKTKVKYSLSKLKSRKKYYIRIRAYKTYQASNGKSKKAYGKYVSISKKTK